MAGEDIRITYKKPSTGSFIVIESQLVAEDQDFLYLKSGKYLKKNIIQAVEVRKNKSELEDLSDDA